jgi:S-DNA-T family DNA segregation ATPase FtsK/SpoIIIE
LRQEEIGSMFRSNTVEEENRPSPLEQFFTLLREGPEVGVHVLAWCDNVANVMRALDRRMLGEFSMRVAGAMSNDDSMKLLDDTAAAHLDKPQHRAIFYDDEHPGVLEKFRPYAIPEKAWLEHIAKRLHTRESRK